MSDGNKGGHVVNVDCVFPIVTEGGVRVAEVTQRIRLAYEAEPPPGTTWPATLTVRALGQAWDMPVTIPVDGPNEAVVRVTHDGLRLLPDEVVYDEVAERDDGKRAPRRARYSLTDRPRVAREAANPKGDE